MSVRFPIILWTVSLAAAAASVMAQAPGAAPSAYPSASAAASVASAPAARSSVRPLAYRSVFDGYRSFNEQSVVPWREANDLVGRIGGWQAYAREGQGEAAPLSPAASTPAASPESVKLAPSPAKPPASAAGHSGHKMP